MIETHTAENIRRLRELNTRIINNLDAVAPRVAEVKEWPFRFVRRRLI
jgi:hypothetical protein